MGTGFLHSLMMYSRIIKYCWWMRPRYQGSLSKDSVYTTELWIYNFILVQLIEFPCKFSSWPFFACQKKGILIPNSIVCYLWYYWVLNGFYTFMFAWYFCLLEYAYSLHKVNKFVTVCFNIFHLKDSMLLAEQTDAHFLQLCLFNFLQHFIKKKPNSDFHWYGLPE